MSNQKSKMTSAKGKSKSGRSMPKAGKYPSNTSIAVTAPSAVSTLKRKVRSNPVRIQMTEEASDVVCQVDFENSALIINPGNEDLFPWLAPIAQQFTSFEWKSISHEFVASTDTATSGSVIMAVQADPDKPAFATEKEILNQQGSATAAPWASFCIDGKSHSTETLGRTKYVQDVTGESALGGLLDDLRTVATGVLNVATVGLALAGSAVTVGTDPAPKVIGKLFTTYDVILWDPVDEISNADEGVSMFTSNADPDLFMNTAVPFSGSQSANPLRMVNGALNIEPTVSVNYFGVTEPGVYTVMFLVNYSDTPTGTLTVSAAGVTPPTFLVEPPIGTKSSPAAQMWYGIVSFSEGALECALQVDVNISDAPLITTAYAWFTQVGGLLDFTEGKLFESLPKGSKGCLPDCKRSAVVSFLRGEARRSKKGQLYSAGQRFLLQGLHQNSASLPKRDGAQATACKKSDSKDSKEFKLPAALSTKGHPTPSAGVVRVVESGIEDAGYVLTTAPPDLKKPALATLKTYFGKQA